MKKIVYKTEADEQLHNAVKATPTHWHIESLPDLELRPQFDRKLLVKTFNHPEDYFFLPVKEQLLWKDTGELFKEVDLPIWEILPTNQENIRRPDGSLMTYDVYETDEAGEIIPDTREEVEVKHKSVDYVRYLCSVGVPIQTIVAMFLPQYIEKFKKEIDDI